MGANRPWDRHVLGCEVVGRRRPTVDQKMQFVYQVEDTNCGILKLKSASPLC